MSTRRILLPRIFFILFVLFCYFAIANGFGQEKEESQQDQTEIVQHEETPAVDQGHGEEGDIVDQGHEEEGHGSDMSPLFFVILSLIIGAATRQGLRKSPLPYTVSLLIIGLGLGAATRLGWFEIWNIGSLHINVEFLSRSVEWAGHIDPHVILYVFLPTLIFEAAFAMDVHTFRKSVGNASMLAIPGIIIAMFLTGALAIGLDLAGIGLPGWGWPIALMFGAVVSATDPVAVVSLLKELGASKKLGTLIEGESLLNDGTAIVIFMVFFLGITGEAAVSSPVIEFIRVALGGTLIGIIVGALTINWVRRVFNDALVEISVIIAAAYITFYMCEHFFHVSGVLGLVALGLAMASIGRTRISPEVEHFLHEFWELAAFIANTLIFLIVGVVIAQQAVFSGKDFLVLGIIYIGVHIIRAVVIGIFYPAMKRVGYGLQLKDSYVLWWGALRGAIGLALALIVAGEESIPENIRNQFLFLTAGLVTLTLLVNATTIKYLVSKLGLTKISPAKALMRANANQYLRQSTENSLEKIKEDRFMSRANWSAVREYLPKDVEKIEEQDIEIETIAETRRRILEKEKSSYWHQFKDGLLGPVAVRRLSDGIDDILDAGGMIPLSERKDLEESWKTPRFLNWMQSLPLVGKLAKRAFFEKLSISYDSARGFVEAQEEALKLVESMYRGLKSDNATKNREEEEKNLAVIEEEINENRIHGQTFLRNLRKNMPEIYSAVATRQAIRSMLNYERRTVERLQKNGRLESEEVKKMVSYIEERMKRLMDSPPSISLPDAIELLKDVPWLQNLGPKVLDKVVGLFQAKVYTVGEKIIRESGHDDGFFFIARGTVKVTVKNKVIDILSHGNFIGEIAGLTGLPRAAEVSAESPVTVLWMSSANMNHIMKESPLLENRLWRIAGFRLAENLLGGIEPYNHWKQNQLRNILSKGKIYKMDEKPDIDLKDKLVILLTGNVTHGKDGRKELKAPALVEQTEEINFGKGCRIFVC
ncbi:MAG: cation:proton antiporter [Bacteroidales bacterium]|nr:MAG: cation:proton antiporter [Bacteroidales bacterium]